MPIRTRQFTPWTPPPFKPFPVGQRSRPAMGTGPAEAGAPGVIGNVFLTIDPLNGQAQVGQRVTITGYRAGGNAPITISWAGPPGSSAPLTSTERTISWIVQAGDSGTYTATATSPGAADSPQSAGIALTVGAPPSTTIGMVTITGIIVPPEPPAFDPDAAAYITAVEAADGQALEEGVKQAMNDLVVALKAINCNMHDVAVLAGPRTLAGALTQLRVPHTWIGSNLTAGDYRRKDGIVFDSGKSSISSITSPFIEEPAPEMSQGVYATSPFIPNPVTPLTGYNRFLSNFSTIDFPAAGGGFNEITVDTAEEIGPLLYRCNLRTPANDRVPTARRMDQKGMYSVSRVSSTQCVANIRGVTYSLAQDYELTATWSVTVLASGEIPYGIAFAYQSNLIDMDAMGSLVDAYLAALATAIP